MVMQQTEVQLDHLEAYFAPYRNNIVGIDAEYETPFGKKRLIYADWIASGRLYAPIEKRISEEIGPFVANTHTETSFTGALLTNAYDQAKKVIKEHVHANDRDVLLFAGTGMTGAVLKLQRILGLKLPEQFADKITIKEEERPVVFITHMEHHSNQTSWLETIARVELIEADESGCVNLQHFDHLLEKHKDRAVKIASVTGCSNVTGILTNYGEIARRIHSAGGYCFVDFACSGPYVDIDMHPEKEACRLDAVFLSPHKFLGGPGSPGVVVFNRDLYNLKVPDGPGGGTVTWTNPWGEHRYFDDIETREDGGTPGFLQAIKAALAIRLKEEMGTQNIHVREKILIEYMLGRMRKIPGMQILAQQNMERLGAISFYYEKVHYNLAVSLLSDHYGIQVRGGCACAGTYGHFLLNVSPELSSDITRKIDEGDASDKPGWVRLSLHPTMTYDDVKFIADALEEIAYNYPKLSRDYHQIHRSNAFVHANGRKEEREMAVHWLSGL
ncbi:MAG: aminotransferase class V-fold PLP-dependent enzyme [Cryomorphaceae bacterium]|nr:aminotransferase class V-fold PLP-dependent enzyme [Cryomorphaceae bacterium]